MFLTMFEKSWNIVLAMHISDVFGEHFKRIEKWQVNPFIFATMCDNNNVFLAVQNSSIGLIVCPLVGSSVCLTKLTIRAFTTLQSDPGDL